jgi:prepilin-type N-terminal cleavage/methylation domain-containing protein
MNRGFGMLEVLVGLTVLSISFFALLSVSRAMLEASRQTSNMIVADYLLEEGIEAVRSIRDRGWTANISSLSGTTSLAFSIATSSPRWNTTSTAEVINGKYWRSVNIASVKRHSTSKDILTDGSGDDDSNTKKITVTVSWMGVAGTTTKSLSTYLTNYFND